MAIHYDKKTGRFKDDKGRFVARDKAMRSSIARREYENATAVQKRKPKALPVAVPVRKPAKPKAARKVDTPPPKPKAKRAPQVQHAKPKPKDAYKAPRKQAAKPSPPPTPVPKKKAPAKKRRPRGRPSPRVEPPWDQEGFIREFPEDDEWFPEVGAWDRDYGYDDVADDWGDYEDDDTTSAGPDGVGGES